MTMISGARGKEFEAALRAAEQENLPSGDRVDMLVEIAMGLQARPRDPADLQAALDLYRRALELCPPQERLQRARVQARQATVLQMMPGEGPAALESARELLHAARAVFEAEAQPLEQAELLMNLGLVEQSLAGYGSGRLPDAIHAYQAALGVFDASAYPREFAILHNNLATAFLALQAGEPQAKLREALAVQSFQAALAWISLESHPVEYAMLQNNLGNALQQLSSAHPLDNLLRAIDAYDEALKVRQPDTMPLEFANTLANRSNCLAALPPAADGGSDRRAEARSGFVRAAEIFEGHGESARAALVRELLAELDAQATAMPTATGAPDRV